MIINTISDDYFTPTEYPHIFSTDLTVDMYSYSAHYLGYLRTVDKVVDYSYSASLSDSYRQSASITVLAPKDEIVWYLRMERFIYADYDPDTQTFNGINWTKVLYKLTKNYYFEDGTTKSVELGYFMPTDTGYNYESSTSELTIGLVGASAALTAEYGGTIVTTRISYPIEDSTSTGGTKYYTVPATLTIEQNTTVGADMFEPFIMRTSVYTRETNTEVPLTSIYVGVPDYYITLKDYEFDNGTAPMDMIDEVMGDCMQNYSVWVDESLILHIDRPPITYGSIVMKFSQYENLVISEDISYSESNYITYCEVVGKDGDYYGYCDWSMYSSNQLRDTVISAEELTDDESCYNRAKWEVYKGMFGHETLSIQIADAYLLSGISNLIGERIEYRTMFGDTNVYKITGISYSSHIWTIDMTLFKSMYLDEKLYTDISQNRTANMLAKPTIAYYEITDDMKIRLYVISDDINKAVVKLYDNAQMVLESVTTGEYEGVSCKIIEYDITTKKVYMLRVQLYNPCYESSLISSYIYVDPYGMMSDTVIIDENSEPITTNDGLLIEI